MTVRPDAPLRRAPIVLVALALLVLLGTAQVARARPQTGVASGVYADRGDARRLSAVGASWTYDWSAESALRSSRVEFVPMLWGAGSVTDTTVARLNADHRAGRARHLLGFNEPDLAGQANMSPADAIRLWPRLEATGLRLGSPAVASIHTPSQSDRAKTWLDDFMERAKAQGRRVDFIALHFYGDPTDPDSVRSIERDIRRVHERWGLPIWVTETGALKTWTWQGARPHARPTAARMRSHLRRTKRMLDRLPYVERWAWFMDRCAGDCRQSSLYDARGKRTALGRELARVAR
ncbi:glycoside hydrolase family protein [Patulibacter minatonensis]|uniref:glycoside hydrolase family protein n=1 Tax=Patulibacter minatonensis TaxID=298163 RepID=UPI000684F419|nr:glycoside hydrolase family protein [Patulibacter minatonensis]